MSPHLALSVLDLSPVPSGTTPAGALHNTLDLARHADALGLTRYWLAEHHNAGGLASSAPEILVAAVAAATRTLRVGAGGIMLPNHSPLKVAETFRALSALHPGRIDLGVGRAAGTDKKTALALRRAPELMGDARFPELLAETLRLLGEDPDPRVPFGPVKAVPTGVAAPELYVLGASDESGAFAGAAGLGYAYAHHFAPAGAATALAAYREAFRPSAFAPEPRAIVAVAMVCGETDARADELAWSGDIQGLRFGQGLRDLPLPSVDEARAQVLDGEEEELRRHHRRAVHVGSARTVAAALRALADASGGAEIMVASAVHDHEERKRGYARLAAELGIAPAAV
ncbi:MAG: Luciferase-like monooxygenase [Labilithrix sp.]|nr:Luciferase-like monooxygenase [Labilithrix sp.]